MDGVTVPVLGHWRAHRPEVAEQPRRWCSLFCKNKNEFLVCGQNWSFFFMEGYLTLLRRSLCSGASFTERSQGFERQMGLWIVTQIDIFQVLTDTWIDMHGKQTYMQLIVGKKKKLGVQLYPMPQNVSAPVLFSVFQFL